MLYKGKKNKNYYLVARVDIKDREEFNKSI
jgi:hypothetical protein